MLRSHESVFVNYLGKLRKYLDKGNYDSALARYNRLKKYYDLLEEESKLKFSYEFESITKQIMLCMKFEELEVVMGGDDLGLMSDYLEEVDYLNNTTFDMPANFRNFVNNTYEKYMNEFGYKVTLNELNELLDEVYKLRDEQNFDFALNMFPKVMSKFKELKSYDVDVDEVHSRLIGLRENLKVGLLKMKAYSDEATVNIKTLKKALKKKDTGHARRMHERAFS